MAYIELALNFIIENPGTTLIYVIITFLVLVGIYDITQKGSIIKHNFPVIGHIYT